MLDIFFAVDLRNDVMRGEEYLTKPQQFALVYSKGSSWSSALVSMKVLPNNLTLSRYGFSVSKRVGKAVKRNRVKRLLREFLRTMPLKSGYDIVFVARTPAATADYTSFRRTVEGLLIRADLLETDAVKEPMMELKAGNVSSL